jgi:protein-disulfide isomerase
MQEQKNNLLIPAAIILAGFAIAGGIYLSKGSTPATPNTNTDSNKGSDIVVSLVSEKDHILGNPDAAVMMVEYSDTECPFCKNFDVTMKSVMSTYGKDGSVAWVYKHFPLDSIHPKTRKEAEATECANELGGNTAFWKVLDSIYTNTPSNNGLDAAQLPVYAKDAGVDVTKFNACLDSGKMASVVEAQFQDGIKAGAQGTPYTVLVLKKELSSGAESTINDFIIKNGLAQNVIISSDKTKVVLSGALPITMIKTVLDAILK